VQKLRVNRLCAWLVALLPALSAAQATATDEVTWVVSNFAPFYIGAGASSGQGVADRLINLVKAEMPEYRHRHQPMTPIRFREYLRNQAQVVSFAFLKDPSLAGQVQYSGATLILPALELTLRREDWDHKWQRQSPFHLAEGMRSGLQLGVAEGRHYSTKLDALIHASRAAANAQLFVRNGDHNTGLAEMATKKRVDATIGYSAELRFAQLGNSRLASLVSVPIAENTDPVFAYAAIPKGEWGDRFRARLNQALLKLRGQAEYRQALVDWFGTTDAWEQAYKARFSAGKMDTAEAGL